MQTIQVKNRGKVKAGDLLFVLNSPQLELREKRAETQVMTLEEQLRRLLTHSDLIQQSQVIQSQLAKALTELQGCRAQKQRLRITAPTSGTMTDMPDGLRPGTWVRQDQLLALLIAPGPIIEGYLPEASLEAVKPGDSGRFYMENGNPPINCTVRQIDPASSRILKTPYLASVYGGEIPVRLENDGTLISHKSLYRVLLTLDEDIPRDTLPFQIARGSVRIKGKPQSLFCRAWRRMMAVVIRESGF